MSLTDVATKYRYEGNGVTDTFSFPAKPFSADSLVVQILTRATDAVVETLLLTTHYSVTIAVDGESASITVTDAGKIPSALQDIFISRSLEASQESEFPKGTTFDTEAVETALDKLTALHQQQVEQIARTIKAPMTEDGTLSLEIPTAATRAEKALIFDASGNLTVSTDDFEDSATIASAAAASASADAASAAASLAAVDAYKMIWQGAWVTATPYVLYDAVSSGGSSYICVTAHTSGVFADDLAAAKWELLASAGASGSGTMASVVAGTGISVDDTDAENPIVTLADTAVTPDSYGSATAIPSFTVDAQGRLTAASDNTLVTANTFTPVVTSAGGGAATYTTQLGTYQKIGNVVSFTARIVLASKGTLGAGVISITGLPTASKNTADLYTAIVFSGNALAAGVTTALQGVIKENVTAIDLYKFVAGSLTQLTVADLNTNSVLIVSGTYISEA